MWAEDWFGDQFEVHDTALFIDFKSMAERFGVVFVYHDFDED